MSIQTMNLEIRAAEGGMDARLFVADLAKAYMKAFEKQSLKYHLLSPLNERDGHQVLVLCVDVPKHKVSVLLNETGGHRIQRIPPTEKRGRVHTSTVTVAVLKKTDVAKNVVIDPSHIRISWFNGTIKAGGQHHQKNATCVRITHLPTNIVKTAQTRSRDNSYALAMQALQTEVSEREANAAHHSVNNHRQAMLGSGMRGDKRRTYRFQDDHVVDHVTGKSGKVSAIMKGNMEVFWG